MTHKNFLWESFEKAIDTRIRPILKSFGFKRRGYVWNRQRAGFVDVIDFQISKKCSSLDCIHFTINVGVFIPEVYATIWDRKKGKFINEVECIVRARPSGLIINSEQPYIHDDWWDVSSQQDEKKVFDEIENLLTTKIIPFIEQFNSLERIEIFVKNSSGSSSYDWAMRFQLAVLQILSGHTDEGKAFLQDAIITKKGWPQKAVEIAARLDLTLEGVPASDLSSDLRQSFTEAIDESIDKVLSKNGFVRTHNDFVNNKMTWIHKGEMVTSFLEIDLDKTSSERCIKFTIWAGIVVPEIQRRITELRRKKDARRDIEWLVCMSASQLESGLFGEADTYKEWAIDSSDKVRETIANMNRFLEKTVIPCLGQFDSLTSIKNFFIRTARSRSPFQQIQFAILLGLLGDTSASREAFLDAVHVAKKWIITTNAEIAAHTMGSFYDETARLKTEEREELARELRKVAPNFGVDLDQALGGC